MVRIPEVKYNVLKEIKEKGSVTGQDLGAVEKTGSAQSRLYRYRKQGLLKKVDVEPTRSRGRGSRFVYGLTDYGDRRLDFFDKVKDYQEEGMSLQKAWDQASEEMS